MGQPMMNNNEEMPWDRWARLARERERERTEPRTPKMDPLAERLAWFREQRERQRRTEALDVSDIAIRQRGIRGKYQPQSESEIVPLLSLIGHDVATLLHEIERLREALRRATHRNYEPIPKRLRFEILKRDRFTCRYCGARPGRTQLHVDHVKPRAEGGTNDPSNLVTACETCNSGKGAVPLTDRMPR